MRPESPAGCPDFLYFMQDEELQMPNTTEEAYDLYITLLRLIDDL